jgi:rubredoxin
MEEKITWKCSNCGYTFEASVGQAPPDTCSSCKQKCEYVNVSCYTPDCGLTGKDPRLG